MDVVGEEGRESISDGEEGQVRACKGGGEWEDAGEWEEEGECEEEGMM